MKVVLPDLREIEYEPQWDQYTALQLLTELKDEIFASSGGRGVNDYLPISTDADLVAKFDTCKAPPLLYIVEKKVYQELMAEKMCDPELSVKHYLATENAKSAGKKRDVKEAIK